MDKRSFICGRDYSIDPRNRPAPTDKKVLETLYDDQEENFSSTESIASASSVRKYFFCLLYLILEILLNHRKIQPQYT